MEENKLASAIKENKCFVCGTEHARHIKVLENVYIVDVRLHGLIPLCNLCSNHYPDSEEASELDLTHLCWKILEKRLFQQTVYTRMCRNNCGSQIVSARKEKEFCSNNCRSKYWQRQAKRKEILSE